MSIIKIDRSQRKQFTTISNTVPRLPNLSWKSKGLWIYLQTCNEDWQVKVSHIEKNFKGGKDMIYSALKELIQHRLCARLQSNENGEFGSVDYIVFEEPLTPEEFKKFLPLPGFPHPENPHAVPSAAHTSIKKEQEKERKKEKKESKRKTLLSSAEADSLFAFFCTELKKREIKPPDKPIWVDQVTRMLQKDGIKKENLQNALEWALNDKFWAQRIMKVKVFRNEFSSILAGLRAFETKSKQDLKPDWVKRKEKNMELAKHFVETYPHWKIGKGCIFYESGTGYEEIGIQSEDFEVKIKFLNERYGGKMKT